ncbi:MAG: penicillin-binding protein activator LpoB [Verrucomicrobia bacterium]|nr:penicillin-binding protein activator LpoB [Verrucomicrobiota bacterium]MBU4292134.1 penicillin-binding protein activator LpoB [Verrucomicrobiota bacterium]MBU4428931.1 penicillin-binding protein activator LpoB [Verrucomicrobiota bacterium]MBU4498477.1 penicillin-binding protein activator LpoB [Verrucomicrobiota bacterium]MCG2680796.1 penicillin-binding protein activator LpoB [Kiritimatiellia bacterium]
MKIGYVMIAGMLLACLALTGCFTPPSQGYVPPEEMGMMTVGLDDHDYDLAVRDIARKLFEKGLPKGYVVALGPVDTRECPYDVRVRQLQKSLQVVLNDEGTLKFMAAIDVMGAGGDAGTEIYRLIEYNWLNQNPIDAEDLQKFGKLAKVNGILFGRVSSLEREMSRGRKEVTYRFVWELANTETGIVDISHEYKIRKNTSAVR